MNNMEQSAQLLDGLKAGGMLIGNSNFTPLKLFFEPKTKRHYYIPEKDLKCNICNKIISRIVIFRFNWDKKKSFYDTFDVDCIPSLNKKKNNTQITETVMALISNTPPKKSYPVFIRPPDLSTFRGDVSVFEAGPMNFRREESPSSNYYNLICSRPVREVDAEKKKQLTDKRIKQLSTHFGNMELPGNKDIDNYLDEILESKILIENKGVKLLE